MDVLGDAIEREQVEAILSAPAVYESGPTCRICFSDEVEPGDRMIAPCRCRGTAKQFVHASCLDRWRLSSARRESVIQCDQCRTPYKQSATFAVRLLASPLQYIVSAILLLLIAIFVSGAVGSVLLWRNQPELFDGTHPFHVQSLSYTGSVADGAVHGAAGVGEVNIFQPSVLVQSVQGMLQRLLQTALHTCMHGATCPSLSSSFWALSTQRFSETLGQLPAGAVSAVPLNFAERLVWLSTLGIAVLGIISSMNVFIAVSILAPSTNFIPFVLIERTDLSSSHVSAGAAADNECIRLVWQSTSLPGVLVFCFAFVGVYRCVVG
ncbi:hypothetical protein MCUN1_001173 [Malassezia cuniculi]|uniref:RING-CH-type domain-containing protein n=1 Tax=Malassezia cuniculi TaxID=948313 RepID=A0AAF0J6A9_9BASI|nr:hypothetical protein MCUN1_001173 [Malassezia cuniculi]